VSALGFVGSVVRGLFKLGVLPLVFGAVFVVVNLGLGALLGALAGAGISEAAGVGFQSTAIVSGVVAAAVSAWFVS